MTQRKHFDAIEAARKRHAYAFAAEIDRMEKSAVAIQLGEHFRETIHVQIRKPWWMPKALYRALMRTIIVSKEVQ